jgi:hypothetical protein
MDLIEKMKNRFWQNSDEKLFTEDHPQYAVPSPVTGLAQSSSESAVRYQMIKTTGNESFHFEASA